MAHGWMGKVGVCVCLGEGGGVLYRKRKGSCGRGNRGALDGGV